MEQSPRYVLYHWAKPLALKVTLKCNQKHKSRQTEEKKCKALKKNSNVASKTKCKHLWSDLCASHFNQGWCYLRLAGHPTLLCKSPAGCWQGQAGSVRTVAVDPTAGVHLGLYLHVNSHGERVSAKHLALTRHLEAASDNCWASQPRSQGGNAWQLPGHGSLGPAARPRLTVAGGFMEMLMRSTC